MLLEDCPIAHTLHFIGGKWKPLILYALKSGPQRTGELLRFIPEVTPKMFTQQIRELERDGLVCRQVYAQTPPRVEYSLSEWGESLRPVLNAMAKWGLRHPPKSRQSFPHCARPPSTKTK